MRVRTCARRAARLAAWGAVALAAFAGWTADAPAASDFEARLARRFAADYRSEFPEEVLTDLRQRAGIEYAYPPGLQSAFVFSFAKPDATVREVLDALAQCGGLYWEARQDTAVFWRKPDEAALAPLEARLRDPDPQVRAEAVSDLGQRADPRAWALLGRAAQDPTPYVADWAALALHGAHPPVACLEGLDAAVAALIRRLPEATDAQRIRLYVLLAQSRHPKAAERIAADLESARQSSAPLHELAALLALTRTPLALDRLSELMQDPANRLAAVRALKRFRHPRAVDLLLRVPADAGTAVRVAACDALAGQGDPRAVDCLLAAARDSNDEVHGAAVRALTAFGDPRALEVYLSVLEKGEERERQREAARPAFLRVSTFSEAAAALARSGEARAVEALLRAARNPAAPQRLEVLPHLAGLTDPRALQTLLALARDADAALAQAALRALGACPQRAATLRLLAGAHADDMDLQRAALDGLIRQRTPEALGPMVPLIRREPVAIRRRAALEALATVRGFETGRALADLFLRPGSDAEFMQGVAGAIARNRRPEALEPLLTYSSGAPELRAAAATALGGFVYDSRAIERLTALLEDPDPAVRRAAVAALLRAAAQRRGAGHYPVAALVRLAALPQEPVRLDALQALASLRDARAVPVVLQQAFDRDRAVRLAAMDLLREQCGAPGLTDAFVTALPEAVKPGDRAFASRYVEFLGRTRDARVVEPLIQAFEAAELSVQLVILEALGETRSPRAFEFLLERYRASRPNRYAPLAALGATLDDRALETLVAAVSDPDESVRLAAGQALPKWLASAKPSAAQKQRARDALAKLAAHLRAPLAVRPFTVPDF